MKVYRTMVGAMLTDHRVTIAEATGETVNIDGVPMVRFEQNRSIVPVDHWHASKREADAAAAAELVRTADGLRRQAAELRGSEHVDGVHFAAAGVVGAWRKCGRECPQMLSNQVLSLIAALEAK